VSGTGAGLAGASTATLVARADAAPSSSSVDDDLSQREAELAAREAELEAQRRELDRERRELERSRGGNGDDVEGFDADAATGTATVSRMPNVPIVVPAGTPLAIELAANLNTKTARVGDKVDGRLAENLVIEERMAASVGAKVTGAVSEVVSGSDKIGGVPTLGVTFDSLVAENGATIPIMARFEQQAKSESGRDAAKIAGGAAAGAVIGRQVDDDDKGTIIGGILGGAAGAAAAKKTGGEIKLRAGTIVNVSTETSFSIYY
jgi:hypothetical protein